MRRRVSRGAVLLLSLLAGSTLPVNARADRGSHFNVFSIEESRPSRSPLVQEIRLQPGEVISRELAGGGVENFKIAVSENQYFGVVVEQLGINLTVALLDPKGTQIVKIESASAAYGPLYLSEIAPTAGDYTLQVRSVENWANPGRYEVKLQSLRAPQQPDPEHIAAERALAEGQRLLSEADQSADKQTEIRRRAISKFTEAVEHFGTLKDRHGEVTSLYLIGMTHQRFLSQSMEAKTFMSQALELAQQLAPNDWRLEATVWNDLGVVYGSLYDEQNARSSLMKALSIFDAHNDRRGRASVSNNLGLSFLRGGEVPKAIEEFEIALKIRRAENDKSNELRTLNNLGGAYDYFGDPGKALSYYEQVLKGWRESKDPRIATGLNNVALAYEKLGQWQQAIDYYRESLSVAGDRSPPGNRATTLLNIGDLYAKMNDSSRAMENYEKALILQRQIKNPSNEASVLAHIGSVHISMGNLAEALKFLEQALQLEEANKTLENRRVQVYTLLGIGEVYRLQSKPADALRYFDEARKLAEAVGDPQQESDAQQKSGETYKALSNWPRAQESYDKALTIRRRLEDKLGQATTLYEIASLQRELNHLPEAAASSAEALQLFENLRGNIDSQQLRTSYFETTQPCFELYIDVRFRLYRIDSNNKHMEEALAANERAHARSLLDALAETSPAIRRGVNPILLRQKQELVEKLNRKAQSRQALLKLREMQQREYDLGLKADQAEAVSKTVQRLAVLGAGIKELISEDDDLGTQIQRESPRYAALTQPRSLSLKEIQNEILDENTLLLSYSLGDRRSFAFVVTSASIKGVELPGRKEIEQAATRLGAAITARNLSVNGEKPGQRKARLSRADVEHKQAASLLSKMVIEPIVSELGQKRMLVVADGALQLIPFAVLPVPLKSDLGLNGTGAKIATTFAAKTAPRLMIDDHEIISLPSASVLGLLRRELQGRQVAPHAVAVLANPVFESSDPRVKNAGRAGNGTAARQIQPVSRLSLDLKETQLPPGLARASRDVGIGRVSWLPYSYDEAQAIMKVAPVGETMVALDFKASRATAISPELSQYRIIHFATHGVADPAEPELSGIILSLVDENGLKQDGHLLLHEIYNLNLPVELVVISACESGVGKQIKGEGLIALTRGFMYAGAARVVASLWKVDDAATATLMALFYKEMFTNGRKPAAALREAQLSVSKQKRWQDPYFWAGFIIQGEWR